MRDGGILNIDVTTKLGGFHGDTSMMVMVGTVTDEARHCARRVRDAVALLRGVISCILRCMLV